MDYLRILPQYDVMPLAGRIQCPTLLTVAERDPLSAHAQDLYDALVCPKVLVRFSDAEGAGDHCEAGNRALFAQRTFDWLDDVLGAGS
jgi:hypothetical protein